jgi:hypothetical protein
VSLSASSAAERLVRSRRRLQRALLDAPTATPGADGGVVIDGVNELLRPTARRHPLGLVAGAVLVGGLLAWSRPWRWDFRPVLFNGLCQQLVRDAVAQTAPQVLSRLLAHWLRVPTR